MTEVRLSPRIGLEATRMTPCSLDLRNGMAFDAWLGIGQRISEIADASAWWLGDWLLYGECTYGNRYKVALKTSSLDYQTLRNYAWVARRFPPSRRREGLSLQHHAEVAALPEPEQDLWLSRAQRARWSRNELRRHLVAARRERPDVSDATTVVCRVELTAAHEQRWRDAAAASETPFVDWIVSVVDAAAGAALRASAV